ncbi:PTS system mannose/fructose/sorbose family transporter subunit IID [Enterococcus dongliensis]|uniref:PTS system mannose/fructose/sorbose family transporter subunit IID n=1 Tax=Enterococcus dongliensis TaxID=2559925 RepID=UPI002890208C|nr:PTS system mannose/fructose/sorbose family transporter subunit IID [Enterococcus dongliensis]MDT2612884.1 PTS system mannose/fructose/sorbose family transporter subunit IID [Enterococcus dongliensis]
MTKQQPDKITTKDLRRAWHRWWLVDEVPRTYDRQVAPAFMYGLTPILKKLYKDPDDLREAYDRHMVFFNTHAIWGGGTITGIVASLEEKRAEETVNEEEITVTDDLINNTKVGLMGALAGIGDSIDNATLQYIFIAIALPWAQQGNIMGALFPWFAFTLVTYLYGWQFVKMGFKMGRNAATEIVKGDKVQKIIEALSILGLFMMGAIASSYVKVSSSLAFKLSGKEFKIQEILDSLVPGLIPLAVVMGIYVYFSKKGLNATRALLWVTLILGVLATIGIL